MMKLKVWHNPQIPGPAFEVCVKTIDEAVLLLVSLAEYDLFQLKHNIKPDYANVSGLQIFNEEEQEWWEWDNEIGENIWDIIRQREEAA